MLLAFAARWCQCGGLYLRASHVATTQAEAGNAARPTAQVARVSIQPENGLPQRPVLAMARPYMREGWHLVVYLVRS